MDSYDRQLAKAQRAIDEGHLDVAERELRELLAARPRDPALAGLAARLLRRQGRLDQARIAYERAIDGTAGDAILHAEYASLLDDLGEGENSVAAYDRALSLAPGMIDAAIDRCIVLTKRVDRERGIADLQALAEANPHAPRAWLTLSLLLRETGMLDEAETAIEQAIELDPSDAKALSARAQLAFDRGGDSSHLFRVAREAAPGARELDLAEIAALRQEGRAADAEAMLEGMVADDPAWSEGLHMLAQVHWQNGERVAFARGYREALEKRPADVDLWVGFATVTQSALGETVALEIVEEARRTIGQHEALDEVEANIRTELGDLTRAAALFARIDRPDDVGLEIARIRFLLRVGALDEAAERGVTLVGRGHGNHAWPYISAAWRKLGDPRWGWLEGDRDFPRVFDLDRLAPELPALAERLRALHTWKVHPFEQSLRGGTQTDSILFSRAEPEIQSLIGHIRGAVREYLENLPPAEPNHPLLSLPRKSFRFTGSWSVRLTDAGFHVNHMHSQGAISSAFYVSLPDTIGGEEDQAGWLKLGEPAAEFGLNLAPLRVVRPKPARLVLFPSWMWHGTKPFPAGERLTVAFDLVTN